MAKPRRPALTDEVVEGLLCVIHHLPDLDDGWPEEIVAEIAVGVEYVHALADWHRATARSRRERNESQRLARRRRAWEERFARAHAEEDRRAEERERQIRASCSKGESCGYRWREGGCRVEDCPG